MDVRCLFVRGVTLLAMALAFRVPAARAAEGGGGADAPELSIHGFGDVLLRTGRVEPSAGPEIKDASFALGQFDLYMVSRLSDQLSFLGEVVIESDESGATVVDLERMFLRMSWSEALRLSAGRTHTALGWWNVAYHHGALLQPMVHRPQALRFEDDGGILPVHSVGAELSGQRSFAGSWAATWIAGVANGRGAIPDAVQGDGDQNLHKATTLNLALAREGDADIRFGASGYLDHIPADPSSPARDGEIREQIGGAHLRAKFAAAELIAEAFLMKHDDSVSGTTFRHRTGYAVLVVGSGPFKPYVAYDRLDAAEGDPFFGPSVTDLTASIGGLRYDFHPFSSLRLEFRHEAHPEGDRNELTLQTAFSF
jgi:hypothetical protein